MTTDELADALREILPVCSKYSDSKLKVKAIAGGIELEYGEMYGAPAVTFATLQKLSTLFGTEKLNVDNYSVSGCDTCDWGSDYGHTIQVTEITKNAELLPSLVALGTLRSRK